jgi:hypothetical protein
MNVDGPFVAGKDARATVQGTKLDPKVAKLQEPLAGFPFVMKIDRMEPERLFSFRWHPHAIEWGVDYSHEPMTLVVFELADAPGGILLTVTESGFDAIPLERRAKAFGANDAGWGMVMNLIEKYLAQKS